MFKNEEQDISILALQLMPEDSLNKLRGAIVGCGYFSQFHIDAWRRMSDVDLVAACDTDISRAQSVAPAAYSDARTMLESEQLDFLDIATQPDSHLPLLRLAINHRIPVVIQKPLAPTWTDAVEAARMVRDSGIRVMVHENWRWQPWYREAKRIISVGGIGRPIMYYFRVRQADGKGNAPFPNQPYFAQMRRFIVWEVLIHHIDTARFLFGDIDSVFACLRRLNPVMTGEDRATLLLQHASHVDGTVDGHRFLGVGDGPVLGDAFIEGEEARLTIDNAGSVWREGELLWRNIAQGYRGDSVYATLRHFADSLRSGEPFETGIRDYLGSVATMEAAYRSAAEQRVVRIQEYLTL